MIHRPRYLIISCFLAGSLGLLGIGLWPRPVLVIENVSQNIELFTSRVQPEDNLWVVFINSVEGLPVADHFVLNEKCRFLFTETIFQAPYAGYLRESQAETVAPRTSRITGYDRLVPEITFFAGYESRHMLFFNGHWVTLYDRSRGGDLIRIAVRRKSPFGSVIQKDADP